MRIVVDMQRAQAGLRTEGRGRFELAFAQALVRHRGQHDVFLALSGLFPDCIESIRVAFRELLPPQHIRIWHAPGPVRACDPHNAVRAEVAALIREALLASLRPDVVYVPGLFDGEDNDVLTTIGVFAQDIPTVAALHELPIGLREPPGDLTRHQMRQVEYLKRASLCHAFPPLTGEVLAALEILPAGNIVLATAGTERGEHYDIDALRLLGRFEELAADRPAKPGSDGVRPATRRRLAYVCPLPPERTGIADYSAELLPALARYYDIDVVVAQEGVSDPWILANCAVRSVDWFRANASRFDRVLYHLGNSHFHRHMFALLDEVPGVVVLHDFYLGHVQAFRELCDAVPHSWVRALYHSHGYRALQDRFRDQDAALWTYPANLPVLEAAQGVIVHSENSPKLARQWYGDTVATDWEVVPLLRCMPSNPDREVARAALGISGEQFVVCSFGVLGPSKLNHRLLAAWKESSLAQQDRCRLVFVGEDPGGEYGAQLSQSIAAQGLAQRVWTTGWVDLPTFRRHLAAADLAVQLRTSSRGETSAAVLDCMAYGLPTIINANGSLAEIATDAVWMLPDEFGDDQLIAALEALHDDAGRRTALGHRARETIRSRHDPATCAARYFETIERFAGLARTGYRALVARVADVSAGETTPLEEVRLAEAIAASVPVGTSRQQILLDVSITCRDDLKTGIQRVVRALTLAMLDAPPAGWRVEPVYLTDRGGKWHYRHARNWTSRMLGVPAGWLGDDPVDYSAGDVMLMVDLAEPFVPEAERAHLYRDLKNAGVSLNFVVYDILPLLLPECFPPGRNAFEVWFDAASRVADRMICISQAVAVEVREWSAQKAPARATPLDVRWFHLGADVQNSAPTTGLPDNAGTLLARFAARPSFLMVGTIEPRKGHLQVLDAFEQLWQRGVDVNLVVVGNEGWQSVPTPMRRTIPQIVERLRGHVERDVRLFWLEGVSDQFLDRIYGTSTCLIAASHGEGFGLPLVEAALHRLPIIARDLPVFREVAGDSAYYFGDAGPDELADAIEAWLALFAGSRHPAPDAMRYLTWEQSARQLLGQVIHSSEAA